jgi:type I restriction-modification system DNA methylase subunit
MTSTDEVMTLRSFVTCEGGTITKRGFKRYARRVSMKEIAEKDYNLNISLYVSTALEEAEVDLATTHAELVRIEGAIAKATAKHNEFLKELGLPLLPSASLDATKK